MIEITLYDNLNILNKLKFYKVNYFRIYRNLLSSLIKPNYQSSIGSSEISVTMLYQKVMSFETKRFYLYLSILSKRQQGSRFYIFISTIKSSRDARIKKIILPI